MSLKIWNYIFKGDFKQIKRGVLIRTDENDTKHDYT